MKKIFNYLLLPTIVITIASCASHVNYVEKAELASCHYNIDSVSVSWGYLQQANSNSKQVVGIDVAQTLVQDAEMLFEDFLHESDLNNAARCMEIIEQIKSFYGEMFFIKEGVAENSIDAHAEQDELQERRLRLADAYYKEAESADRLWKRHNDPAEKQRYEHAIEMAHKYNPDTY